MRKKLVGTLLIAAMTASTLAGCGSSNSTAGTSASGGAAETSPVFLTITSQCNGKDI